MDITTVRRAISNRIRSEMSHLSQADATSAAFVALDALYLNPEYLQAIAESAEALHNASEASGS